MTKTKSDEVAVKLEQAILGGEFKPGDSLPSQSVLASRYGVGLRAVRSALGILEVKGLVAIYQGRRPVVSDNSLQLYMEFLLHSMGGNLAMDDGILANLVGLMGMISAQSGKLTALAPIQRRRRTVGELRRIIDRLKVFCNKNNDPSPMTNYYRKKIYPSNFESLVHSFHMELVSSSGNRILTAVYKALYAILSPHTKTFVYSKEEAEREIDNLERIANGVMSGDTNVVLASLIVSLDERVRKCLKQKPLLASGAPGAPSGAASGDPFLPQAAGFAPDVLAGAKKKTKGEIIAQDIEEQILGGKYRSGDLLPPQNELCELYGASPRSIRDALGRLQTRALVDVGQGRRTRVRTSRLDHYIASLSSSMRSAQKVDGKLVMDLIQLDLILAISAIRTACASPSPDKAALGKLKNLAGRMRGLLPAIDEGGKPALAKFAALEGRFHRTLLALNPNPFLDTIYDDLVSFLEMENSVGLTERSLRETKTAIWEHGHLMEAIERKQSCLAISIVVVILSGIGRKLAESYGLVWPTGAKAAK